MEPVRWCAAVGGMRCPRVPGLAVQFAGAAAVGVMALTALEQTAWSREMGAIDLETPGSIRGLVPSWAGGGFPPGVEGVEARVVGGHGMFWWSVAAFVPVEAFATSPPLCATPRRPRFQVLTKSGAVPPLVVLLDSPNEEVGPGVVPREYGATLAVGLCIHVRGNGE